MRPAAYAGIKTQLLHSATHRLAESLENEARVQAELGATADHRAATLAFVNRQRLLTGSDRRSRGASGN